MSRQDRPSLTPIHEVYHRLRWDPRFNQARFTIRYQERSGALKDKPLTAWQPQGDIPWHRVTQVRCGQEVVWDRQARVERLDELLLAQLTPSQRDDEAQEQVLGAAQGAWRALPCWAYEDEATGWRPLDPERTLPNPAMAQVLRVATLNLLMDRREQPESAFGLRRDAALGALESLDAHVLVLTEVTPTMIASLLEAPWIRGSYYASEGPLGQSLEPYGQLILSRWPMRVRRMTLMGHKRLWAAQLLWPGAGPSAGPGAGAQLVVAALHLVSNAADGAAAKRADQLQAALTALSDCPALLVMGDLNLGPGELGHVLDAHGLVDVWEQLRPEEAGPTFDPTRNALARRHSLSGQPSRYDRILVRAGLLATLRPSHVRRFAQAPIRASLPLSDHEGVTAQLALNPGLAQEASPSAQDAAIVELAPGAWAQVQAIRRAHDRSVDRWMPHINLLFPFVPKAAFQDAARVLREALAGMEPFELELDHFGSFTHDKTLTVWLGAKDEAPLRELQRRMQQALPRCADPRAAARGGGYQPHLTVARFDRRDPQAMREAVSRWERDWRPVRQAVLEVALISRQGQEAFEVCQRVPLGLRGACQGALLNALGPDDDALAQRVVQELEATLRRAAPDQALRVELVGSRRMGVANPGADVDLLVVGQGPTRALGARLVGALPARLGARALLDLEAPVVRLRLEGLRVDLTLARADAAPSSALSLESLDLESLDLDALSLRAPTLSALGALRMAARVHEELALTDAAAQVRQAARMLKAWAQARGVYGSAWGFWAGISWTLATIWAAQERAMRQEPMQAELIVMEVIERLCQWPWPEPLPTWGVGSSAPTGDAALESWTRQDALMPTPSLLDDGVNTARGMTRASARVMREQLRAARAVVESIRAGSVSMSALLEPRRPWRSGECGLWVSAPEEDTSGDVLALIRRQWLQAQVRLEGVAGMPKLLPCSRPDEQGRWWLGMSQAMSASQQRALLKELDAEGLARAGAGLGPWQP